MDRRRRTILIAVAVAVVGAIVFAVWWFVLRSDAPPPVSLDDAVAAATSTTAGTTTTAAAPAGSTTTAPASTTTAPTTTSTATDGGIEGTWTVGGDSFVGYRVNEELATIGVTTAAGRTSAVTGSLTIEGDVVVEVTIEADLRGLESDDSRRDRFLRSRSLETDRFPTSTFALDTPIPLPSEASSGEPFTIQATGQFTLHGVTREITIDLQAQLVGDVIAVVGSMEVVFADYDIAEPSAIVVLSVEDRGVMEFQLLFSR